MSLRKKVIWITVSVLALTMSIAFVVSVFFQASALREADEKRAASELEIFISNLDLTRQFQDVGNVTGRTQDIIDTYLFSRVAGFSDQRTVWYSLSDLNGSLLYSRCPYEPLELAGSFKQKKLSGSDGEETLPVVSRAEVSGKTLLILRDSYHDSADRLVILTKDVSETEALIRRLELMSVITLLLAVSLSILLISLLIRKTLAPIGILTRSASAIADGNYALRTSVSSGDEIGALSRAFDRMADAVEEKITTLDTELKKKDLLLGALSHELKTPMTAVIGYAESLVHMPLSPEMRKTCALQILEAGRQAENLSEKMMEIISLSEQASIEKAAVKTGDLVDILQDLFPEHVSFSVSEETLFGDKTLLISLISNLVQNALKNMPEDTVPDVRVSILSEGDTDVIQVRDNGIGIPAEHIPYLTEPFYRVDKARSRKTGGIGLGLSLVRMIVDLHEGTYVLESMPGEGTCVTISLPKGKAAAALFSDIME